MTQPGLIIVGDVLDGLARLDADSVDAIVTDPPYELAFMGKKWDATGVAFRQETWEACLRVLKPGGHLIAFGGGRTHHRMWCAIEDAGFEVRELVCWLFGTGFPKSLDVSKALDRAAGAERKVTGQGKGRTGLAAQPHGGSVHSDDNYQWPGEFDITAPATDAAKQWEGYGTALKPAVEPILLARKPLSEPTVAANVLKWGTGALAIDATRIGTAVDSRRSQGSFPHDDDAWQPHQEVTGQVGSGRWPANVIFECTCDDPQPLPETVRKRKNEPTQSKLLGGAEPTPEPETPQATVHQPDCPAGMLDAQSGERKSPQPYTRKSGSASKEVYGDYDSRDGKINASYGDTGGASRYFYCAKASRAERERGLEDFKPITGAEAVNRRADTAGLKSPRAGAGRTSGTGLTKRDIIGAWVNEVLEAVRQADMARFLRQVTEGFGSADGAEWSTTSSGKRRTGQSQTDLKSTTETETGSTTDSETSDSLTTLRISAFIRAALSELESGLSPADFAACRSRLIERTGTSAKKAGRSTDAAALAISEKLSALSAEGGLPVGVGVRNAHPT